MVAWYTHWSFDSLYTYHCRHLYIYNLNTYISFFVAFFSAKTLASTIYGCSFREMISYGLHDLHLCAKACYVMSSFLQQAAEIHGFTTRNKLSKLVASVHMNRTHRSGGLVTSHDNPFLPLLHQLRVPHPVPKLEKKSSAPIHSWPNRTSHGVISCHLYPLASLTDFLFTWWWTG